MLDIPFGQIGEVVSGKKLVVKDSAGNSVIDSDTSVLKSAWQNPLNLG